MQPFTTHTGQAVPLRRSNVDTDQIIPAEYLKRVNREGFGDGLFAAWRADPEFVLNQPAAAGATILIAGPDFGIGSSREHAVWALLDYGFRVVISARFGDIFYSNATKAGLIPARMEAAAVMALQDAAEADPAAVVTVDLPSREVRLATGPDEPAQITAPFEMDDYTRWRLLEGLDDISLTLRHAADITRYEASRAGWLPVAG
ncbi:MAG TPA: 3-isopropylmalate dehydratase small subunit [Streptosporangiaceae bacterium]